MKKKPNWFLRILLILIIIFFGLYIASCSGYYERMIGNKVALRDEEIKQFEQDVLDGKVVDLNNYVTEEYVDYNNVISKTGDKFGEAIGIFIEDGLSGVWDAIKMLFF